MRGTWPSEARFVLDQMAMHGPAVSGEASGETAAVPGGATLKMKLSVGQSDMGDVLRLWPSFINADARNWCLAAHPRRPTPVRLDDGRLGRRRLRRRDPQARGAGRQRARRVRDPRHRRRSAARRAALSALDANGVITGHDFAAGAKSGVIEMSPTRRIQVSDITYTVPDTTPAADRAGPGRAPICKAPPTRSPIS